MGYTFEEIPKILRNIEDRLEKIEKLLSAKTQNEPEEDVFIGAKEACQLLKLTLPTLYSKICHREVPYYKKGNRLHFSKAELLDWIQEGKKKTLDEISGMGKDILRRR